MTTKLIQGPVAKLPTKFGQFNITIFKENDVLGYIEIGYGIFHCEGDEAVLDDITDFLNRKGIKINA